MTNAVTAYSVMNMLCRLQPVDVMACFSWLLTMLVCGWLGESICRHTFLIHLTFASATVAVSSCSLLFHCCGSRQSQPCLSQYVCCCFLFTFVVKTTENGMTGKISSESCLPILVYLCLLFSSVKGILANRG